MCATHAGHAQRDPGCKSQGFAVQGRPWPSQENRAHQSYAAAKSWYSAAASGVQSRGGCADNSSVDKEPGTPLEMDTMRVGVFSLSTLSSLFLPFVGSSPSLHPREAEGYLSFRPVERRLLMWIPETLVRAQARRSYLKILH